MATSAQETPAGRRIGRYELMGELGRGGMAVVYLARQPELDRLVALKELGSERPADGSWAARFLRESRLASSLAHPNIVTVFDYFECDGAPYIAMEYLERGSLRECMKGLSLAQIGGLLEDVLAGLAHAERRSIVHRDLKPENLLVTADGSAKIADFGIAKATHDLRTDSFRTATGVTVGTPGYMAPEQAMARPLGPPTDLYSVGCIAYELFVGRTPFGDIGDPIAVLLHHVHEAVVPAHVAEPRVHPAISDWISALLQKNPSERPQGAAVAWESLEEILIAQLGARWRRGAGLHEAPPADPVPEVRYSVPGPYTPPPRFVTFDDPPDPLRAAFPRSDEVAPPAEEEPRGEATVAPTPPAPPEPVAAPPASRRRFRAGRVALAAVIVVAAPAAAILASSGTTPVRSPRNVARVQPTPAAVATPDRGYARAINGAVSTLDATTAAAARGLGRARTPAAQARAAADAGHRFRAVRKRIDGLAPPSGSGAQRRKLSAAVLRTGSAYAALAEAARAHDRHAYTLAARRIVTGRNAVRAALASISAGGYRGLIHATLHDRVTPPLRHRKRPRPADTPSTSTSATPASPEPVSTPAPVISTPSAPRPAVTTTPKHTTSSGGGSIVVAEPK